MAKRVLEIVESDHAQLTGSTGRSGLAAHTLALRRAGADVHLLLQGNAVAYGIKGQAPATSQSGGHEQQPPALPEHLLSLVQKGAKIYYVEDDAQALHISADQLANGLKSVRRNDLPALLHGYEQIWHW